MRKVCEQNDRGWAGRRGEWRADRPDVAAARRDFAVAPFARNNSGTRLRARGCKPRIAAVTSAKLGTAARWWSTVSSRTPLS